MSDGLIGAIRENADKISFHTPSHAGILPEEVCEWDVTELSYTDNLLSPTSHIAILEKNMASAFGAEACFISTQGATGNIFMAIYATKDRGGYLVVGKAHVAIYNALRTFNCRVYHTDEFAEEVPDEVKTLIVTSPDYFGRTLPLEKISAFAKKNGLALIVDSAHGSHFAFSDKLPVSAAAYADLAILSLHKTLPVMTGGSVLCVKREYADRAIAARKILHTTSPSFAVLCSIERAIGDYKKNGKKYYDEVIEHVEEFEKGLKKPFVAEQRDDKTRLVISSPYDGAEVEKILSEKGFVAECSIGNAVIFIVNPNNCRHLGELSEAVNGIGDLPLYDRVNFPSKAHPKPTPMDLSGEPEAVPVSEAEGRLAFCEVGFYPPGVPLLYSHDRITKEHVAILSDKKYRRYVFGLENDRIFVVK